MNAALDRVDVAGTPDVFLAVLGDDWDAVEDAYLAAFIPLPVGSLNCDFPVVAPEADLWTFPIDAPCEDPAAIGPFLGLGGVVHPVQRALLDAGDPRGRHLHGEHDHLREDLGRIE